MGVNLPVVLVANKSDLVSEREAKRTLSEEMVPVMQEFKEVESCIRCSAKARFNVNEVLKYLSTLIEGILLMSTSSHTPNRTHSLPTFD
jgi:GTPase SAR1 family protein